MLSIKQIEAFHCFASDRIVDIIGSRSNRHHEGTTSGDCILQAAKSDLHQCPVLPPATKHMMMGKDARVIDSSRGKTGGKSKDGDKATKDDDGSVPSVTSLSSPWEPMNFSMQSFTLLDEIVHRFRPRLYVALTASCPSLMRPLLEGNIPCVAVCALAEFSWLVVGCWLGSWFVAWLVGWRVDV